MSHINWRPMTAEDEAQMMEHLDPEEREILAAQNAKEYTFPPPASPEEVRRFRRSLGTPWPSRSVSGYG